MYGERIASGISPCGSGISPLFQGLPRVRMGSLGLQSGRPLVKARTASPRRARLRMNLQSDPNAWAVTKFGVGQPVLRTEDPMLVRGEGRFTDDVSLPRQAHAVIVRSRHAHGVIRRIDTDAARNMPGRPCGLHRRRPDRGRLRHAQVHRAVQQPRRLADEEAGAAVRCRPTRCATSATRSPAWSRKRCCRRRTPPRRSSSTSSRCRP